MADLDNEEHRAQMILRLNRIEGQIRGIRKMVEEERSCEDILSQVAAVKGAMNSLSSRIIDSYVRNCVLGKLDGQIPVETVDRLLDVFKKIQNQG